MARWRPNQPTPSSQGVYALVAAVGEQFSVVSEVQSTGSHLSPYRRRTIEVPNILNRLALHGLDKAIANMDPDSKRIYMALPAAQMAGVAPSAREGVAISKIVSELEKMSQRLEWDRIVIATPAYQALELSGLASKLQGFGLFSQPLCQAGCADDLHTRPGRSGCCYLGRQDHKGQNLYRAVFLHRGTGSGSEIPRDTRQTARIRQSEAGRPELQTLGHQSKRRPEVRGGPYF